MVWCRVLFPDLVSSSRHVVDPGQYNLLSALDLSLYVECEMPCWKMNGNIMSPSLVTTPTTMMRTGFLVFINTNMNLLRLIPKHYKMFVLELPQWMPISTACHFQIYGRVNCIIELIFSQTVPDWLLFAAKWTKPETNKVHGQNQYFKMVTIYSLHPVYKVCLDSKFFFKHVLIKYYR